MNAPEDRSRSNDPILEEAYNEMRRLARRRVMQFGINSIQATDLVNDAYVHLVEKGRSWESRKELFFLAARAMRDLLVQRARQNASKKRGGDWKRVNWEAAAEVAGDHPEDFLLLNGALDKLEQESPEHARVVEMLYFAGFTGDETAEALGTSASTIDRRWRFARAWLVRALSEGQAGGEQ